MALLERRFEKNRFSAAVRALLPLFFICSLLLCSCSDNYDYSETSETVTPDLSNSGKPFYYGYYEQDGDEDNGKELLAWKLIEETEDSLLLISNNVIDCGRYGDTFKNISWKQSEIYSFLNGEFYNEAFSEEMKEHFIEGEAGKVYLLSQAEYYHYFAIGINYVNNSVNTPFFIENGTPYSEYAQQKAKMTLIDGRGPWMLRNDEASLMIEMVSTDGTLKEREINAPGIGIRPLIRLKKSALDVTIALVLADDVGDFADWEEISFEYGDLLKISNKTKETLSKENVPDMYLDVSEISNNSFSVPTYGNNILWLDINGFEYPINVYAEPAAIRIVQTEQFFKIRELTENDIPSFDLFSGLYFVLENNRLDTIQSEKYLKIIDQGPVTAGQTKIRAVYKNCEFEIKIKVITEEVTNEKGQEDSEK